VRGTIVCGVVDNDEGRGALELAAELSERLGLRLVLAHVADGSATVDGEGAARLVERLAAEHGVEERGEQRSAVGDPAALLGQIASEEAAGLIVVGSRARCRMRRGLESGLADRLESETSLPIVIAPPRTSRRRSRAAIGARR
jgi:nucleotide-binding universal stress UspA family protein